MTTAQQFALIYDRLNNQPHLQELIATPILQEMEDKEKLDQNTSKSTIPFKYEFGGRSSICCASRSSKYWKKKMKTDNASFYKLYYKSVKKTEKLAKERGCNPFPSFDVMIDLKIAISDCIDDAQITYPKSKKKRDKYILDFPSRMLKKNE